MTRSHFSFNSLRQISQDEAVMQIDCFSLAYAFYLQRHVTKVLSFLIAPASQAQRTNLGLVTLEPTQAKKFSI